MTTFALCKLWLQWLSYVPFFLISLFNARQVEVFRIDHAIKVKLLMLSCSPDICLCRYLGRQNTSCICSGSLTYHFLYVIAFTRDISSLVLGKFLTIFIYSTWSSCTYIYFMFMLMCREHWAYLDDFRGTFRWHICFNFGKLFLDFGYKKLLHVCDLYTCDLSRCIFLLNLYFNYFIALWLTMNYVFPHFRLGIWCHSMCGLCFILWTTQVF